jgi:hypothetical protein
VPDLWDTNPDHVFGTPGEEPDPAPSGRDEHPKKVVLTDHTGRLGLPTYVLIMLVVVLAATVLLTVALLVAPT